MSTLKDNTYQYKQEIKNSFLSLNPDNRGVIETQKLNDFITSFSKKKNPFLFNSIKSLTALKKKQNKEGISPEEYISFIDNQLSDAQSNDGLKKIFNVFCDSNSGNISWNTFPLIAKELGDDEIAGQLLNIIKQSKMYTKELNFKEFFDIMNSQTDENDYTLNNGMSENGENINMNNLNINEYLEDYEEKPTYKQRKLLEKMNREKENENENEKDITSSEKNSYQENEEIIVEEKYYDNDNPKEEINADTDKSNKRYHRRYRSKKIKNNSNNDINENIDIKNNGYKSYSKYRKKHPNY